MTTSTTVTRLIGTGLLLAALALAGCKGDTGSSGLAGATGQPGQPGQPGEPGQPGASTGTLTGTVTNSMTKTVVQGVTVSGEPKVQGVSMTTDAQGNYSAQLPIGAYTLTFKGSNFKPATVTCSVTAGGTVTVNMALDPVAPVVLASSVQGSAVPGNTVTVTATVSPMDGSAVVSTTWVQKSGAAVEISQPQGGAVQVGLPDVTVFKDKFFRIVDQERHALLDRNMVMGISPLDLEEAGNVVLTLTVRTTSGTYSYDVTIAAALPFVWSTGIRNVATGLPVLLHGKTGTGTHHWSIVGPAGSQVTTVQDADTQNPYFTSDLVGKYVLTESTSGASIEVFAGTWVGAIGPDGQPSALCTTCHNGTLAPDKFTPWIQSGHAEIFTQNLNAGGHYSSSCFPCHTVGYNTDVNNGGFDDAPGYAGFLNQFFPGGHSPPTNPNNWSNVLAQFPSVARLANAQCENCHGPNGSPAHGGTSPGNPRVSLSSDVCGSCHGEPPRHGRFQQWQESLHANYQLAEDEGTVEGRGATAAHCGRCHTGQGFLAWIKQGDLTKQIQGANGNATVAELTALGLTRDTVQPQTCATCHDPHAEGNVSGEPNNATVRIQGDTPLLPAGYAAQAVGRGALCITCHNTRNGLHNDSVGPPTSYTAPHTAAQGDVLMGENAYFVSVGQRSPHSFIADTCATCHMELTPPPAEFSLSGAGTNHAFKASISICTQCHGAFDGGTLQASVEAELENLANLMSTYLMARITTTGTITISDYTPHTFGGKNYDMKSGAVAVPASNISALALTEPHGQQGFIVTFNSPVTFTYSPTNENPHSLALNQATVQLGDFLSSDGTTKLIAASDPLVRAGWNYFLIHGDSSKGVHNPAFALDALGSAQTALQTAMSSH